MHILVITPGFPKNIDDTDCIPPMQIFFKNFIKTFSDIKISVISIHYPYTSSTYIWNGINVYSCGGSNKKLPSRLFYWIKVVQQSLKINKNLKVNLIHSFWLGEAAMLGDIIRRFLKVKHINTMMGQDALESNKYLKYIPLKNIRRIALSEFQSKKFIRSTGLNPDGIIPWGIDKLNIKGEFRSIDVIGVGSILPVKNFDLFVDIIKSLTIDFPNLKSVIIGEGTEREKIENKIKELNLVNTIKLTGHLRYEKVFEFMQKSKILLHTSNYESYGFVIAEALASGCYVISREVGCVKEEKKLFVAETVISFAQKIKSVLSSELEFSPIILHPSKLTVESYYKLYSDTFKH